MISKDLVFDDLEAAFLSIGEGAIIINEDGVIVKANRYALRLLGYRKKEIIGRPALSTLIALNADSEVIKNIDRPIVQALIRGKPVYEYLYYQRKNLTHVPVFISASPIMKHSKPIGLITIIRDISMEEAIDQMKSEFISLASHQLRTPLSSIKTYSHMLLDGYMGKLDDQKRPALDVIISASNRMNELISTLLSITRLESGSILIERRTIDIASIAKEVIDEMAVPASNRDISIKLVVKGAASPQIKSDGPIVKEIITNLVSNSVKYSVEHGTVILSIMPENDYISIVVKDKGLGIPGAAKEQIFTKFFRAHNVIQQEPSGTGLGLYLTKGLVDELGGHISFSSKEGLGTLFKVRLPKDYSPLKSNISH